MIDTTLEQPRGRFALTGGRIVLPEQVVTGQALVIEGGKVVGLAEAGALGSDIVKIDVGGRTITPGLVDIYRGDVWHIAGLRAVARRLVSGMVLESS